VHVACADLQSDPVGTAERVHRQLGVAWDVAAANRAAAFLADNARGRTHRHRYSDEGWGVTTDHVDGLFGDYRRRFAEFISVTGEHPA
jgi:hypothetical protein